jgi:hypothetical protein
MRGFGSKGPRGQQRIEKEFLTMHQQDQRNRCDCCLNTPFINIEMEL